MTSPQDGCSAAGGCRLPARHLQALLQPCTLDLTLRTVCSAVQFMFYLFIKYIPLIKAFKAPWQIYKLRQNKQSEGIANSERMEALLFFYRFNTF